MNAVVTAYRAKNPQIIREWLDNRKTQHEHYVDGCKSLAAEIGVPVEKMMAFRGGFGESASAFPTGFQANGSDDLPEGFRYDAKLRYAVPAKRTEAGKAWSSKFNAAGFKPGPLPGFNEVVYGPKSQSSDDGFFTAPVVKEHDGTIFALLSVVPKDPVDLDLWEPVKLSSYHLAKEKAEEES